MCSLAPPRDPPPLTQIGVTLLQAVATFLLLGAALPLVRPRLPLPPKSQGDRDKKEESSRGAAVAGEAEAAKSVQSPAAQPVTFKRMATNTRLLAFLAANSQVTRRWRRIQLRLVLLTRSACPQSCKASGTLSHCCTCRLLPP